MTTPKHETYEILVMKAVDGQLSDEERAQLDAHLATCQICREELMDFRAIKDSTDQVRQRILQDARLEPFHESPTIRTWNRTSFALIALGTLVLSGVGMYHFFLDPKVHWLVKLATGTLGAGALGLFFRLLHVRLRSYQHDPYREIDL